MGRTGAAIDRCGSSRQIVPAMARSPAQDLLERETRYSYGDRPARARRVESWPKTPGSLSATNSCCAKAPIITSTTARVRASPSNEARARIIAWRRCGSAAASIPPSPASTGSFRSMPPPCVMKAGSTPSPGPAARASPRLSPRLAVSAFRCSATIRWCSTCPIP